MASKGFLDLADRLEEAATALSHNDIRSRLSSHLSDKHAGTGDYAYLVDTFGDDKSGQAVYSKNGKMKRAAYKMGMADGKPTVKVETDTAEDVHPRTTYESQREIEEALSGKEVEITGEILPLKEGAVGQDGTVFLKVIKPGWGSSGYYSEQVLERDLPKIYPAGTKNFWNHQTDAEEAARPEGDLRDLASVTTEPVQYMKNGPDGPGGYVKAKAFENYKQPIDDLAKYIGTSIRASGKAKEGKAEGRSGPIIQELTRGISIDYVTTPGAGGKILQLFEAARAAKSTEAPPNIELKEAATDMDAAELTKLQESVAKNAAENRKLRERLALTEAATAAKSYFGSVRVSEAIQERVISRVLAGSIPLTEAGDLDGVKLKTLVEAECKEEVTYINRLSNGRIVTGMGSGADAPALSEADKQAIKEADDEDARQFVELFIDSDRNPVGAKIMREGRRAFNPNYNSAAGKRIAEGVGVNE